MFVRTMPELDALGRIRFPSDGSFRSARFITAEDGLGFSYNDNSVRNGTTLTVWLKHHWEANYIVSGKGEVTDLTRQETWSLDPGVLYTVGPNDRHRLSFTEDERHISIFCPPLRGDERFDEDGAYEPSGPIEKTERRMFVRRLDDLHVSGKPTTASNGQMRETDMLSLDEALGFSVNDAKIEAGAVVDLRVDHHCQAIHVLSGSGDVTDLQDGRSWPIETSTAIAAGPDDIPRIRATTDLHVLRVIAPALQRGD